MPSLRLCQWDQKEQDVFWRWHGGGGWGGRSWKQHLGSYCGPRELMVLLPRRGFHLSSYLVGVCATSHMCRSEDSVWGSALFFTMWVTLRPERCPSQPLGLSHFSAGDGPSETKGLSRFPWALKLEWWLLLSFLSWWKIDMGTIHFQLGLKYIVSEFLKAFHRVFMRRGPCLSL